MAEVGHDFTYTLTVTNHGPSSATSVVVTDPLPSAVKLLGTGGACGGKTKLTCALGTLANGATRRIHVRVQALRAGSVTNTAEVTSAVSDPNLSNDHSAAQIKLVVPATCSGPLVFRTRFDSDDEVVLGPSSTSTAAWMPHVSRRLSQGDGHATHNPALVPDPVSYLPSTTQQIRTFLDRDAHLPGVLGRADEHPQHQTTR